MRLPGRRRNTFYLEVFELKKILFCCLIAGSFTACDDPSVQRSPLAGLFVDAESLMDIQVRLLDSLQPEVSKTIVINAQAQDHTTQDINWEKELAIFKELNISKPGLQSSYTVSSPSPKVRVYTLKPEEHANVQWLKVTFASDTAQIQTIEGLTKRTNYLYQSEKLLHVSFRPTTQRVVQLVSYQIESRKKILFGEEEKLKIQGKLTSP